MVPLQGATSGQPLLLHCAQRGFDRGPDALIGTNRLNRRVFGRGDGAEEHGQYSGDPTRMARRLRAPSAPPFPRLSGWRRAPRRLRAHAGISSCFPKRCKTALQLRDLFAPRRQRRGACQVADLAERMRPAQLAHLLEVVVDGVDIRDEQLLRPPEANWMGDSSRRVAVLHARNCRGCERPFSICCGCDRGHVYGSDHCRDEAKKKRRYAHGMSVTAHACSILKLFDASLVRSLPGSS